MGKIIIHWVFCNLLAFKSQSIYKSKFYTKFSRTEFLISDNKNKK